jgi:hypothetical protein
VSDEEIARLIEQLGGKDFKAREAATRRLRELDEALPALRRALQAPVNEEMRRRAESALAVIESRQAEKFIRQAVERVNEVGLDLFIDRMVLQKGPATEARWKATVELARALARRAKGFGTLLPKALERDFLKLPTVTAVERQNAFAARVLIDGTRDRLNAVHQCLVVSSGPLEQLNSTDGSVLFVNGDIDSLNSTTNCVIICNGTIRRLNFTKGCVIYCNGVIEGMNGTEDNAVFVRGELRRLNFTRNNVIEAKQLGSGTVSEGNTYLNRTEVQATSSKGDRFLTADPSPLNLFAFFDLARAGLRFTMVEGGARVDVATAGKPFARAGLQKGDLIAEVNQEKAAAAESFVRLMRRRVAAGVARLKVQRGERVLEITVPLGP